MNRLTINQELHREALKAITRRQLFRRCGTGMGAIALTSLLNENLFGATSSAPELDPLAPRAPHFAPRAKNIIYLHMAGAPSQLDLFDNKPKLAEYNGQPIPDSLTKGERFAFIKGTPKVLGSPYKFARYGQGGVELSELLPHLATVADDIAVVKSMHTDQFNHAPAQLFVHTGSQIQGRPSMGSWVTYGLGTENRDLPAFVVLLSGPNNPDGGTSLWSSGFLPSVYQGTQFRSQGEPVLFVSNPLGVSADVRRKTLDALRDLNGSELSRTGDPEITTRIEQYELAYRMQTTVPELSDISKEPQAFHEMYGTEPGKVSFANNCLLARRLVERGVRFVQLYDWGWDTHGTGPTDDLITQLPKKCKSIDQASTALIKDLKNRGLLDQTLIIWGGEFGRTPMNEARNGSKFLGRDHHPHAFALWMAGGGIKGGLTLGATDELGYNAAEERVHVHDLQATILAAMGLEHTRLTYRFQGRDFRLTDVHGNVVSKLLA
ncbi:MAG TPA: DUF1501 domain-containing protein [Humisphaera sp.]|jgi:hypothetical protein|nr:DUF1501 domain-containing protein [Humisphaera sp.]